jgi:L-lactate dehydrogenase complex protein LldF
VQAPFRERAVMRAVAWTFMGRRRFALAQRLARVSQRLLAPRAWTKTRELKSIPAESFRSWWRRERR